MTPQWQIGTSGWSYKHWKGGFYPQGLPTRSWLSFYGDWFPATEINASFYRLPSRETVAAWAAAVRPDFRFCPKMSRYLTHLKKLRDPEEPLARFFEVFEPMERQLGPILFQLPPQLPYQRAVAEPLFELLRTKYVKYSFVWEVRHPSWLADEPLQLLSAYGIGLVIAQSGGIFPYSEAITAPLVYVRMHGPDQLYASAYSDADLEGLAGRLRAWRAEGCATWVFFNNDIHGYAPEDAKRLMMLLGNGHP